MKYRIEYIEIDKKSEKFIYLILLFVFSILLIILRPNAIIIILGWDGLGLISYLLILFFQNEKRYTRAILTVLRNRIGDIGLLIRIFICVSIYSWRIIEIINISNIYNIIIVFVFIGIITKRAQLPFSSWLPAAIAAPTPVSSLVHSSTLVTAGIYLGMRYYVYFDCTYMRSILFYISVITTFISGLNAIWENDIKKIIALSTLSQLGIIIISLSLGSYIYIVAFFHLIRHAFFKAILFLCSGVVIHNSNGEQDLRKILLLNNNMYIVYIIIILAKLSLCAWPFLRGFYRKDIILESIYFFNNRYIRILLIWLRTILTVLYSLRFVYYLFIKINHSINIFINLKNIRNIEKSILYLSFFIIIFGRIISWILNINEYFLFISFGVKIFNLILVIIRLIFYTFIFNKNYSNNNNNIFISLFHLNLIFSIWDVKKISLYLNEIDQGFYLEISSSGFNKIFYNNINFLNKILYSLSFFIFITFINFY